MAAWVWKAVLVWKGLRDGRHLGAGQGNLKGADMLRDAPRLAGRHRRLAQCVQQGRLKESTPGSASPIL